MSTQEGISIGGHHGGQGSRGAAQALSRLQVDDRLLSFTNGIIGPKVLGRIDDPTGDSEEAETLRTLLAYLRRAGVIE